MRHSDSACAGRRHLVRRNLAIGDRRLRRDGLGPMDDAVGQSRSLRASSARSNRWRRAGCPLVAGFSEGELLARRALRGPTC